MLRLIFIIAIASIVGIIYGVGKMNKPLAVLSVAAQIMAIAVWVYFYNNPS